MILSKKIVQPLSYSRKNILDYFRWLNHSWLKFDVLLLTKQSLFWLNLTLFCRYQTLCNNLWWLSMTSCVLFVECSPAILGLFRIFKALLDFSATHLNFLCSFWWLWFSSSLQSLSMVSGTSSVVTLRISSTVLYQKIVLLFHLK